MLCNYSVHSPLCVGGCVTEREGERERNGVIAATSVSVQDRLFIILKYETLANLTMQLMREAAYFLKARTKQTSSPPPLLPPL